MKISFNPSGTHIDKESLRVRLDLIPDIGDLSYPIHHINAPTEVCPYEIGTKQFNEWVKTVPREWRTNPCLNIFIRIGEMTNLNDLLAFLAQRYTPDKVATLDTIQSYTDNIRLLVPFMADKTVLTDQRVKTKDYADLIASVNQRFTGLYLPLSKGISEIIAPGSITIGSDVIGRANAQSSITIVEGVAASAAGTITTVSIWFDINFGNATGVEIATFIIVSGNNLSTDDVLAWGNVNAGSKQDSTGLTWDVTTGHYIGEYFTGTARVETTLGSGSCWYKTGDNIPCTNAAFSTAAQIQSCGGVGTEAGGGWGGEFCGVAVAEFDGVVPAEIDGV